MATATDMNGGTYDLIPSMRGGGFNIATILVTLGALVFFLYAYIIKKSAGDKKKKQ